MYAKPILKFYLGFFQYLFVQFDNVVELAMLHIQKNALNDSPAVSRNIRK